MIHIPLIYIVVEYSPILLTHIPMLLSNVPMFSVGGKYGNDIESSLLSEAKYLKTVVNIWFDDGISEYIFIC